MNRLDLLSPDVRKNPYPYYAELRRSAPVTQVDPGGLWAVSRHDDVVAVLKNPEVFSSQGLRAATVQPWIDHNPIADSLVVMDPPHHGKIRALVTGAFGTRVLPRIEPLVREIAGEFAARAPGSGEIDACDALSSALPASVIASLLGFDPALRGRFRAWSDDLVAISAGTPEEIQPRIVASIASLKQYLMEVIDDRRRQRRDDLVSDLLDAEIDGQRLSTDELVSFFFVLLVAGYETTAHLLTNGLRVLADRPELIARLRAEPARIPAFVEEVLRFDPPVHATMRLARVDTEIAGVRVPAGSIVMALLGSACQDERHFDNADQFDIDRRLRTKIVFGHGIHYCLGAALARTEARIAFEELIPRISAVRLTAEPTWNLSVTVRGATTCPMVLVPARTSSAVRPGLRTAGPESSGSSSRRLAQSAGG